jgi:YHS domain-containing protein
MAGTVDADVAADKAALGRLQEFVGSWRGVGQPRRGSTQGAWTETADWAWKFADNRATLVFEAPKGKYYRTATLSPGEKDGTFDLVAKRANDAGEDRFSGKLDNDELVLLAAGNDDRPADAPGRITIRTVAEGDRLLVLYEKRTAGERYARLAEVGYTRAGVSFAKGSGEPECVVTGGAGTIAVEYQGKKYYVCCTGCRDLFNDDPEGVLAEYRERKAAEREKATKK